MQIRRRGCQKKVNAKSLNVFYNLFCMFTTIFRSPYSRAPTFIGHDFTDRLIMLFSAAPAKCSDKRGGGASSTWINWEHQKDGGLKKRGGGVLLDRGTGPFPVQMSLAPRMPLALAQLCCFFLPDLYCFQREINGDFGTEGGAPCSPRVHTWIHKHKTPKHAGLFQEAIIGTPKCATHQTHSLYADCVQIKAAVV